MPNATSQLALHRYQELFEQAPVSIQILAPDGRTIRVNKAWHELWQIYEGTALNDLVFSAGYNVLTDPQLVQSGIAVLLQRAFAGESVEIPSARYDVAALGGDGPARWVTARAHPIKDGEGKVLEVMLMHEDITERVENESALRLREERFRSLVMATSQIVWTNTPDGRVLEDSPSWRAFTGQTYDQWKELGWLDALHPDDRAPTGALWQACVAARSVFETNYRIRCPDGRYRWTAVKGVPILATDGSVREWIGANTDIHDMVMAEQALAQRLDHEQRTSLMLGKVAHAARTLHKVLSFEDISRTLVAEVRDILQVHQAAVSLAEAGTGAMVKTAMSASEKYAEKPPQPGRLSVALIDRAGKQIGLIEAEGKIEGDFTVEDEAILLQLASIACTGFENAKLYCSLQEQDRRKDEFLAMLAHELRNPLAPITSAAYLLELKAHDEQLVRRSAQVIGRQVRHLTSLVNSLLDVSRVTHGLIQLDTAVIDPMAIIADAVEQSQPLIAAHHHAFTMQGTAGGALIVGDAVRLTQVLVNLLNNAAKYTPHGGRIELLIARRGAVVSIEVRDNGIGIDARLLPHVFDLFVQAERSMDRAQGGLGIGLALVREIVALHGGQVVAHSAGAGLGSAFSLTLNATDGKERS
ncbi:ATP-binding protein [Janthinobacterium psychrotolerans]|uniref:histidine kinase n=1 Tax=Janthinobacterium psychrotolerans TaxID=1747903 RepID=A0A1A7C2Z6_9BURK|nr:ATP-binding protein [Janthinobacterium psychrotolerans]OBV38688.1 PAS domain S-box-containing protein [Janthinobacterium psychrotolerans]